MGYYTDYGDDCHVCALGALMLAKANADGSCARPRDGSEVRRCLAEVFDHGELRSIECFYENWIPRPNDERTLERFVHKYTTPEARMKAIMQNIIKNKGTFKP